MLKTENTTLLLIVTNPMFFIKRTQVSAYHGFTLSTALAVLLSVPPSKQTLYVDRLLKQNQ